MANVKLTQSKNGNQVNGHHKVPVGSLSPFVFCGSRLISADDPCLVVAEIGLNHCGQVDRALKLIEAAADAGADAVKFQKRSPRDLLTHEAYNQSYYNGGNSFGVTYGLHREALEFDISAYRDLKAASEELGMHFFASVWDLNSLDEVMELDVPVIKIPSADLTNEPLIRAAIATGKPLFISTGMSRLEEVEATVSLIRENNAPVVLFHCISLYPTPVDQSRLSTLRHYAEKFKVPVGYSGHELEGSVAVAARVLGACVIEKHFTIDRSWKGGDQNISLLPHEFAQMVDDIRIAEKALLSGVRSGFIEGEQRQRKKLGKSIVARCQIPAGATITEEMLTCKCPGGGLSPQNISRLIGKRVKWDIAPDEYVLESHLEEPQRGSLLVEDGE